MSLEALLANMKPYDVLLHEVRGFGGAVKTANNLNKLIAGKMKVKVQDAYSMRSIPQGCVSVWVATC